MLVKWPITALNASKLTAPLVALYYLPVLPVGALLNRVDLERDNDTGTGLLVTAQRPG